MYVYWMEAEPWDYAANAAVTVRACSADISRAVNFAGFEWEPIVRYGPDTQLSVFDGAAVSASRVTYGLLECFGNDPILDLWDGYGWSSRPIRIYEFDVGTNNPLAPTWPANLAATTLIFDGQVSTFDADQARFELTATLPTGKVADAVYQGTGGVEGPIELKNVVKPFAGGYLFNREPVLVDAGLLLYQVHGYGAIEQLTNVREKGIILDQTRVAQASAAALLAATVLPTQIHTFLASGLFRLGFRPIGDITCDILGDKNPTYSARIGSQVMRLLLKSGWPLAKIDAASITDLDASLPFDCFIYDDDGRDIVDVLNDALTPLGAYWDVNEVGVFYVGLFRKRAAITHTVSESSDLNVFDIDSLPTRAPFWKNRVGWKFNPQELVFPRDMATTDIVDEAGAPLSDAAIKNSNITVGGTGILNGIGTANVPVANTAITITAAGVLSGIGTASIVVNNSRITVNASTGVLTGAGTAGVVVANSRILVDAVTGIMSGIGTANIPVNNQKITIADAVISGIGTANVEVDNSAMANVVASTNMLFVQCDHLGAPLTGEFPKTVNFTRKRGSTDVSASTTWTILSAPGMTSTIGTSGIWSLTGLTADKAHLVIRSTRNGINLDIGVDVEKKLADPPAPVGGATVATWTNTDVAAVFATGFTDILAARTVRTGSAGTVAMVLPLTVGAASEAPHGTFEVEVRWQISTDGGTTYNTVGTTAPSNPDLIIALDPEPPGFYYIQALGSVSCNRTATGLAANTDVLVKAEAKINGGTVRLCTLTATSNPTATGG